MHSSSQRQQYRSEKLSQVAVAFEVLHSICDSSLVGVAGLLLEQAQRAQAGVAQQPGQLCHEGTLHQGHQGALRLLVPGQHTMAVK